APEFIQHVCASHNFAKHGETAVHRIEKSVVGKIEKPLGRGGVGQAAHSRHSQCAVFIAVASADVVFVGDWTERRNVHDNLSGRPVGDKITATLDYEIWITTMDEHV